MEDLDDDTANSLDQARWCLLYNLIWISLDDRPGFYFPDSNPCIGCTFYFTTFFFTSFYQGYPLVLHQGYVVSLTNEIYKAEEARKAHDFS